MGQPVKLTIGLIVKNEEKNLPNCLEAIKPILEAVPSELIITDTGSNDETVKIAKDYTDKVLSFKWCGDFSAARNTALEIAQGEWFWYLDADEWMEDIEKLIDFLRSEESQKYKSIQYEIRNYINSEANEYASIYVTRIVKRTKAIRFTGKIHETIPCEEPTKMIEMYAHHNGYDYSRRPELKLQKFKRNIEPLLEAYHNNPNDVKVILYLIREYDSVDHLEEMSKYIDLALDKVKHKGSDPYFYAVYGRKIKQLFDQKAYLEAIKLAEEYLNESKEKHLKDLDIFCYMGMSYAKLGEYQKAINYFEKYFNLYNRYKKGEKFYNDERIDPVLFWQYKAYNKALAFMGQAYFYLKQYHKMYDYYDQLDFSLWDDTIDIYLDSIGTSKCYEKYKTLYEKSQDTGLAEKVDICLEKIEQHYIDDATMRREFVKVFNELTVEEENIPYFKLNQLRSYVDLEQEESVQKELSYFDTIEMKVLYADIIYMGMKISGDLSKILNTIKKEEIGLYLQKLQHLHQDFNEIAMAWCKKENEVLQPSELYWRIVVEESILIDQPPQMDLFEQYLNDVELYKHKWGKSAEELANIFEFADYIKQAEKMLEQGNSLAYVKNLNKAVKVYPVMKDYIEILLQILEKVYDEEKKQREEMAQYARLIKGKVEQLLELGMIQQAKEIVLTLVKIMPQDADVIRYLDKIRHLEGQ